MDDSDKTVSDEHDQQMKEAHNAALKRSKSMGIGAFPRSRSDSTVVRKMQSGKKIYSSTANNTPSKPQHDTSSKQARRASMTNLATFNLEKYLAGKNQSGDATAAKFTAVGLSNGIPFDLDDTKSLKTISSATVQKHSLYEKKLSEYGASEVVDEDDDLDELKDSSKVYYRCLWQMRSIPIFRPYESWRMIWDILLILLILYTAFSVPFRLSWDIRDSIAIIVIDRTIDFAFLADIMINFNTAFERGTELVLDRRQIIPHYFKGWFLLDFVSSFPFDWVLSSLEENGQYSSADSDWTQLARLIRLFKLSKLFRLARLQRILRRVQLKLGIRNSIAKIFRFSGGAILCLHWMSCAFYFTSTFSLSPEIGKQGEFDTWVKRSDDNDELSQDSQLQTYIAAMYWSMSTMTSIGYGDISPKAPSERLFGIVGMVFGAVLFGHFMGNVLAIVADMSPIENACKLIS